MFTSSILTISNFILMTGLEDKQFHVKRETKKNWLGTDLFTMTKRHGSRGKSILASFRAEEKNPFWLHASSILFETKILCLMKPSLASCPMTLADVSETRWTALSTACVWQGQSGTLNGEPLMAVSCSSVSDIESGCSESFSDSQSIKSGYSHASKLILGMTYGQTQEEAIACFSMLSNCRP